MMQRGNISFSVIITLVILTTVIMGNNYYSHSAVSVIASDKHGDKAKNNAINRTIEQIANLHTPIIKENVGKNSISRKSYVIKGGNFEKLYTSQYVDFESGWSSIDYNSYFEQFSKCKTKPISSFNSTVSSFRLTSSAIKSNFTCSYNFLGQLSPYVINGNFESIMPFTILGVPLTVNKLTATGYVDISTLVLIQDTLIIAGGDIHIGMLLNLTGGEINITFVSATGIVQVDLLPSSDINIKSIAYLGSYVPDTDMNSSSIVPRILPIGVIGITGDK